MTETVTLEVVRAADSDVPLPRYATSGAAGLDLTAALREPLTLQSLERALVPTGLRVAIPEGFEGQVRPRSGLALKRGLTVLNAPGTIDCDYRGEIGVVLVNVSREAATIEPGERIAQLVVTRVARAELVEVRDLSETARGLGGYGSTGAR